MNASTALPADETVEERSQLTALIGRATALYAHKNYDEAAEIYADACQLQEKLNGELATDNAQLLYAYGRCLYHVAIAKSDVLGGKSLAEVPGKPSNKRKARDTDDDVAPDEPAGAASKKAKVTGSGRLEINGDDADWESSDDSDGIADDDAQDQAAEDQDDDFANAWDILDMARCILARKVEAHGAQEQNGEGEGNGNGVATISSAERADKEMLADTIDLQAEIALENENFVDAVDKARDALALQTQIYAEDSNRVAEAHFKLALALEFASVARQPALEDTPQGGASSAASGAAQDKSPSFNKAMRDEAVQQMELSMRSTRLRLAREERALAELGPGQAASSKQVEIDEVKEVISDMEIKLADLRAPPVALSVLDEADKVGPDGDIRALLGSLIGGLDGKEGMAKLEEVTKSANDLTGMVRKKEKKVGAGGGAQTNDNAAKRTR